MKLCKSLEGSSLTELDLSENPMPYFCIDALVQCLPSTLKTLKLCGCRLDDLTAYHLLRYTHRQLELVYLDGNPLLAFAFYSETLNLVS